MPEPIDAVRRVLAEAPCSTRALAQTAGISPALLSRILSGERSLTVETATALAEGLGQWSDTCGRLAKEMREVAKALASDKGD